MNKIEHINTIDIVLREFEQRNPEKYVAIRYTTELPDEHAMDVLIPEDDETSSEILVNVLIPIGEAPYVIAQALGVIEAGYDADDDARYDAVKHFMECVESRAVASLTMH